ncbi:MAG: response regulator [Deltaproteobacteria bacterium]|nr:response regulator [Deltaproteobacteria bacterium]
MKHPLLSLAENPPRGFVHKPDLSRRDVRSKTFALFTGSVGEAELRLRELTTRPNGILVTCSGDFLWERREGSLFHMGVPEALREYIHLILPVCLDLLETIHRQADNEKRLYFELTRAVDDLRMLSGDFSMSRKSLLEEISERRAAEAALRESRAQLLHAQKMEAVGTLAGGIAHDFNNLLQAITGFTSLALLEIPEGNDSRHLIRKIGMASDRASELVKRLLTFSRMEPPEKRPLDLNREISHTVSLLERVIPKMIGIETRLYPNLVPIEGDPTQIEQVVMNLGANARDAMPEGGCLLFETEITEVTAGAVPETADMPPGDYVLLRVSDTGVGMSPETVNRIFDPFFTTKEIGSGTGLGLSTVYGIVRGHGGWIRCNSSPGSGTSFEIFLPPFRSTDLITALEISRGMEVDPSGGTESILIVDDEYMVRDVAKIVLEGRGYTVRCARSGENALEMFLADGWSPDLVLLDLGMPGMGGRKCLAEILKRKPDTKVLVASGYSTDHQAAGIVDAGARGFIGKPYKTIELVRKVRDILDGP